MDNFFDPKDVEEHLTIRYSPVEGELTDAQVKFIRNLPVDLMDLVSILRDQGITVEVCYPAKPVERPFPRDRITVRTGPAS